MVMERSALKPLLLALLLCFCLLGFWIVVAPLLGLELGMGENGDRDWKKLKGTRKSNMVNF